MPRWCLLPAFSIVLLVQETSTTLLGRESFETSSKLQARGTNVLQDNYFIPAIATISAFVVLSLVCLFFLGCCCNSRKMDEYYSRSADPPRPIRNSASYQQRPTVNLNSADASDKYSNVSQPRTTPHATPPAPPPASLQQTPWSNGNQWPSTVPPPPPPPPSHGFQSPAHTAVPPSVMSVRHLNPTAATYQHREAERSQVVQRPHIQPDSRRMSSMSSGTSSTQIGSGAGGEQVPYIYSPHQGNTLSYASSTNPSMIAPVWEGSRMPTNENNLAVVGQDYSDQVHGPPAYIDDPKGRLGDMRKS